MDKTLFIKFTKTNSEIDSDLYLKRIIRRAVSATLEYERFPFDATVSVTLCDNAYIRELNNKYRGVDKHTDVLSFPMYDGGDFDIAECISGAILGDIVISLERAEEQARELGHGFLREVAFLAIHSTLHLLGYDHERSSEEDERQCTAQREIIERVEI